jgi:hypothetical protein
MKQSQEVVATHEAGHVLVILRSPLRNHILQARVYLKDDEWRGETELQGERGKVDPIGVYEFAKGLAGPVTQLHFYPKSPDEDWVEVLKASKGLLDAARHIVEKKLPIKSNWWPDLLHWTQYCRRCLDAKRPICAESYFKVEEEINRVLTQDSAKALVQDLAARLTKEGCLGREELLAIPTKQLPEFSFPNSLPL